jgi:hypothetical protein
VAPRWPFTEHLLGSKFLCKVLGIRCRGAIQVVALVGLTLRKEMVTSARRWEGPG